MNSNNKLSLVLFFEMEGTIEKFIFVLDQSGSMLQHIGNIEPFLQTFPTTDNCEVIGFSLKHQNQVMVYHYPSGVDMDLSKILHVDNGTPGHAFLGPLCQTLETIQDTSKVVVFFISDGAFEYNDPYERYFDSCKPYMKQFHPVFISCGETAAFDKLLPMIEFSYGHSIFEVSTNLDGLREKVIKMFSNCNVRPNTFKTPFTFETQKFISAKIPNLKNLDLVVEDDDFVTFAQGVIKYCRLMDKCTLNEIIRTLIKLKICEQRNQLINIAQDNVTVNINNSCEIVDFMNNEISITKKNNSTQNNQVTSTQMDLVDPLWRKCTKTEHTIFYRIVTYTDSECKNRVLSELLDSELLIIGDSNVYYYIIEVYSKLDDEILLTLKIDDQFKHFKLKNGSGIIDGGKQERLCFFASTSVIKDILENKPVKSESFQIQFKLAKEFTYSQPEKVNNPSEFTYSQPEKVKTPSEFKAVYNEFHFSNKKPRTEPLKFLGSNTTSGFNFESKSTNKWPQDVKTSSTHPYNYDSFANKQPACSFGSIAPSTPSFFASKPAGSFGPIASTSKAVSNLYPSTPDVQQRSSFFASKPVGSFDSNVNFSIDSSTNLTQSSEPVTSSFLSNGFASVGFSQVPEVFDQPQKHKIPARNLLLDGKNVFQCGNEQSIINNFTFDNTETFDVYIQPNNNFSQKTFYNVRDSFYKNTCIICLDEDSTFMYNVCKHAILCHMCVDNLTPIYRHTCQLCKTAGEIIPSGDLKKILMPV